jgi:VanZ family protein
MKKIYRLQFWIFLLFCTYLSLTPVVPDNLQNYSDKFLHSLGYLALFLSCALAYPQKPWQLLTACLFSYSVSIEIIQTFIPNRGFAFFDILANALGLGLGLGLNFLLRKAAEKIGLSQV